VLDEVQKVSGWSERVKRLWDQDSATGLALRVLLLALVCMTFDTRLSSDPSARIVAGAVVAPGAGSERFGGVGAVFVRTGGELCHYWSALSSPAMKNIIISALNSLYFSLSEPTEFFITRAL